MVIGIVGGMGSYATLDLFERYLSIFNAEKEWDRPRIIIDNRCTMPSRVRALLYDEKREQLVNELTDSIKRLVDAGCDYVVLACNTSHVFLEEIFKKAPETQPYVLNIIELCAEHIVSSGLNKDDTLALIATEGTIQSKIYQETFKKYGLDVVSPSETVFKELRFFIEAVKTNSLDNQITTEFCDFLRKQPGNNLILGCTEFPVIFNKLKKPKSIQSLNVFDPLEATLLFLHKVFTKRIK
jgi:aspartate racemase